MLYDNFMRVKMKNISQYKTAIGYPCEFETKKEQELFDYRIYGNSGGVGDKTKNLLPYPYTTKSNTTKNGITFTSYDDGSIMLNGTASANAVFYVYQNFTSISELFNIGDTITISKNVSDKSQEAFVYFICNYYNKDGTMQAGPTTNIYNSATKTVTSDWIGLGIYILVLNGKTVNNLVVKPMIQKGSIATEYEPYGYKIPIKITNNIEEEVTTNIYIDEPLRKIDDYVDYVDYENQKVVRNVREFVFAENPNVKSFCSEYTYGTDMDNTYHFQIRNMSCVNRCSIYSNILRAGDIVMNTNATDSFFTSQYSAAGQVYIQMEKALIDGLEGETNVDKLWNYLIENNAIIVYATTTVLEESADLPPVTVPNGNVILKTDTTIEPSKITVKYKK